MYYLFTGYQRDATKEVMTYLTYRIKPFSTILLITSLKYIDNNTVIRRVKAIRTSKLACLFKYAIDIELASYMNTKSPGYVIRYIIWLYVYFLSPQYIINTLIHSN
jgi:hypothetical protein